MAETRSVVNTSSRPFHVKFSMT